MTFDAWLAKLLGQAEQDVQKLLADATATQFLIAWSLFEAKCFNGYMEAKEIEPFSKKIVQQEKFDPALIADAASHFHDRYQDQGVYRHLTQGRESAKMEGILKQKLDVVTPEDKVFLVSFTVFRYRNNIFHGNKPVDTWLKFRPQIERCIDVMKTLINHAESRNPSLLTPDTA